MQSHGLVVPFSTVCLAVLGACAAGAPRSAELPHVRAAAGGAAWSADAERGPAAAAPREHEPAEGERRIAVGLGFTDDPDALLIGGHADFYMSDTVAIGPSLQWGVDDDFTIFAPSFHGKIVFPLESDGDTLVMPFGKAGAGLAYIDVDGGGDDIGFLLQLGGGLEIRLSEKYALASTAQVNLLPGEVEGERAYFSWEIVQFSFTF